MWRGVSDGRLRGLVVSGMAWPVGSERLLCPSRLSCILLYSDSPSSTSERQVVVQHPLVSRSSRGTYPGRGSRRATRWQEAHQSRDSQSR